MSSDKQMYNDYANKPEVRWHKLDAKLLVGNKLFIASPLSTL